MSKLVTDVKWVTKVAVGLASHWPCVTDDVIYPPTGSTAYVREMSTPPTLLLEYGLVRTVRVRCRRRVEPTVTADVAST